MGNPFVHFELNTDDVGKAKAFYKKLFDWKIVDMPEMAYTMFQTSPKAGGGMQNKHMAEEPTHWLCYVEVASVKTTLAKAQKAGAQIVVPYMPIGDGSMGAMGVFVDPQGAALGLWEKGKPAKKAAKKSAKKAAKKAPAKKAAKRAPAKKAAKKAAKKR